MPIPQISLSSIPLRTIFCFSYFFGLPTSPKGKKPNKKSRGIKFKTCRLFLPLWADNPTREYSFGHLDQFDKWPWCMPHLTLLVFDHFSYLRRKFHDFLGIKIHSNSYFTFHSHIDLNIGVLTLQVNTLSITSKAHNHRSKICILT